MDIGRNLWLSRREITAYGEVDYRHRCGWHQSGRRAGHTEGAAGGIAGGPHARGQRVREELRPDHAPDWALGARGRRQGKCGRHRHLRARSAQSQNRSGANPPNLPGWRDIELAKLVEKEFGLPAKLENDANAAGLAEVLFGAAVGYKDVFYVTVSTGIGTGIIINRKIYHGKNGIAGEGGHVSIDYRSPYRCGCGTYGCIEALAAGPAMARRARVMLEQEHSLPSVLREPDAWPCRRDYPADDSAGGAQRRPRGEDRSG